MEYTVHVWAQKGDRESKKADTMAPTGNRREEENKLGLSLWAGLLLLSYGTVAEVWHCCFGACGLRDCGLFCEFAVNKTKQNWPKERTKHYNRLSNEQSYESLKLLSKACVFNHCASQL